LPRANPLAPAFGDDAIAEVEIDRPPADAIACFEDDEGFTSGALQFAAGSQSRKSGTDDCYVDNRAATALRGLRTRLATQPEPAGNGSGSHRLQDRTARKSAVRR